MTTNEPPVGGEGEVPVPMFHEALWEPTLDRWANLSDLERLMIRDMADRYAIESLMAAATRDDFAGEAERNAAADIMGLLFAVSWELSTLRGDEVPAWSHFRDLIREVRRGRAREAVQSLMKEMADREAAA